MPAISDASPLILFSRIARLDLLADVFGDIIVPSAVWAEVVTNGQDRPGASAVAEASWIRAVSCPLTDLRTALADELGLGEAECITLTVEQHPSLPVILDDRKGRDVAHRLGLQILGCAGVPLLAKEMGVIPAVAPVLDELLSAGLRLAGSVKQEILTIAGE